MHSRRRTPSSTASHAAACRPSSWWPRNSARGSANDRRRPVRSLGCAGWSPSGRPTPGAMHRPSLYSRVSSASSSSFHSSPCSKVAHWRSTCLSAPGASLRTGMAPPMERGSQLLQCKHLAPGSPALALGGVRAPKLAGSASPLLRLLLLLLHPLLYPRTSGLMVRSVLAGDGTDGGVDSVEVQWARGDNDDGVLQGEGDSEAGPARSPSSHPSRVGCCMEVARATGPAENRPMEQTGHATATAGTPNPTLVTPACTARTAPAATAHSAREAPPRRALAPPDPASATTVTRPGSDTHTCTTWSRGTPHPGSAWP